jgi:hypothetical protein
MTQPQPPGRTNPFPSPEERPLSPEQCTPPSGSVPDSAADGDAGPPAGSSPYPPTVWPAFGSAADGDAGPPAGSSPYPPTVWPAFDTAPWQYAPPTTAGPSPPRGFAVAALVLGIVALLLFWVPFLGLVLGLIAFVFGAIAVQRSGRRPVRQDEGKAVAGIVTGFLAVAASTVFFGLTLAFMDDASQAGSGSAAPAERTGDGSGTDTSDPPADTTTYQEDFDSGAGRFEVSSYDGWIGKHGDGAYFLSSSETDTVLWSSAAIDTATAVDVSASLELVGGAGPDSSVGLIVQPTPDEGYVLELYGDGSVTILRLVEGHEITVPLTEARTSAPDGPSTLRMTVAWTPQGTDLVGYVDGQRVVRHVDRAFSELPRWSQFNSAGVVLTTGGKPGTVRADDVVVRTPG